jgi:hypothetical protein
MRGRGRWVEGPLSVSRVWPPRVRTPKPYLPAARDAHHRLYNKGRQRGHELNCSSTRPRRSTVTPTPITLDNMSGKGKGGKVGGKSGGKASAAAGDAKGASRSSRAGLQVC